MAFRTPARSSCAAAALLGVLVLLGAGCGRDAPELSDFDRTADKLCTESAGEQEELLQDPDFVELAAGPASLLTELADRRTELARDLADLEPSEDQASDVDAFIASERDRAKATLALARAETRAPTEPPPQAAVRAERTAHERAGRAARTLNLEECAERLTPDAREEVVDVIRDAYSAPEPEDRCNQYSERYLLERWQGEEERCALDLARTGAEQPVEVFGTNGIADVFATAAAHVGPDPGKGFVVLRLTFEDGRYRVDEASPAGPDVAARGPAPVSEGP